MIEESLQKEIKQNPDVRISVYFTDLTTQNSVGQNENLEYKPASLNKVSLLMAYYKIAEEDPNILSQKVEFAGPSLNQSQNISSLNWINLGQAYTVQELLRSMIVNSDNDAAVALYYANQAAVEKIIKSLGVAVPTGSDINDDYLSPKKYSTLFSSLYDNSYLNSDYSKEALKLLGETAYKDGIVAGVPPDITVAHKFGDQTFKNSVDGNPIHEFHDCGIVYYPQKPYLLCVMTEGDNLNKLQHIIRNISASVYKEVSR